MRKENTIREQKRKSRKKNDVTGEGTYKMGFQYIGWRLQRDAEISIKKKVKNLLLFQIFFSLKKKKTFQWLSYWQIGSTNRTRIDFYSN